MNEQGLSIVTSTLEFPNYFPTTVAPYRIAVVGEAPTEVEFEERRPFTDPTGLFLRTIMSNCGIDPDVCFLGYLCNVRPPNDELFHFSWDGPELQRGLRQLKHDLDKFNPNLIVLIGDSGLVAATGQTLKSNLFRGSIFKCNRIDSPFYERKYISVMRPKDVLKDYSMMPLMAFDLRRARDQGTSPDWTPPQRELLIHLDSSEICSRLDSIEDGVEVSVDIEGGIQQGMHCLSISTDPVESFLVPFGRFPVDDEARVFRSLHRVLNSPAIPKVLQNALYDRMVLAYRYGILIQNIKEDTMVKSWEIYSELPKDLGTLGSVWTLEPYYKFERKADDQATHHRYCCKDSAMTLEISRAMDSSLSGRPRDHYNFNMALLDPLLYMQLSGWNFDLELAKQKQLELKLAKSECLVRIRTHISMDVNPNSPKQVAHLLYDLKGLPKQFKKKNGRLTTQVTTDTVALLNLSQHHRDPVLMEILLFRALGKLEDVVHAQLDKDNRLRCSYNVVGTETGRISCSGSVTGSGFNLQTVTKKLRCLFRADPDHHLFQCDLSGADGWTVAAHCLNQGDPTMWDDYRFGLKPAKIIAAMYEHGRDINRMPREELARICKTVDQDGWLYFTCKRVQHGTNYELGKNTMVTQIMKDSYKILGKPIYVEPKFTSDLQSLYLSRYPGVRLWQNFIKRQVLEKGYIVSASGHVRKLFGRRRRGREVDHDTYRAALAEEPQANTTYVTNIALYKLWHDPANRIQLQNGRTSFIVRPVHQVHDALIGQFPTSATDWAVSKIREWFSEPITIANTSLVIPFEGAYGPSWGHLKTAI